MPDPATAAGIIAFGLFAAHGIADHWLQTVHQVNHKGDHSARGQWTCARHAAVHVLTAAPVLAAIVVLLDVPLTATGLAAGQAWTFTTHYLIDRRWTVRKVAGWIGKDEFHGLGAPRPHTVLARTHVTIRTESGHWQKEPRDAVVPLDMPVLGTGQYALDQTAHVAALFVAALLTALI